MTEPLNRIKIIQHFIDKLNAKSYLEIGVQSGDCFKQIRCEHKVGVDPDTGSAATIHKTSDDFFAENRQKFDVCFVDGLHHADQVYKDVINCLSVLNEGGVIVMHDCLPTSKRMQQIPLQEQNEWCGNVWEAFVKLRRERNDLEMCVVNCDYGCGIVRFGKQELLTTADNPTYEDFCLYKHTWMNIISVEQFKKTF